MQEANKEVLLGKRKLNCLSCGPEGEKLNHIMGQNGQMYRSGGVKDDAFSKNTNLVSYPTHANTLRASAIDSGDIKNVIDQTMSKNNLN